MKTICQKAQVIERKRIAQGRSDIQRKDRYIESQLEIKYPATYVWLRKIITRTKDLSQRILCQSTWMIVCLITVYKHALRWWVGLPTQHATWRLHPKSVKERWRLTSNVLQSEPMRASKCLISLWLLSFVVTVSEYGIWLLLDYNGLLVKYQFTSWAFNQKVS